MEKESEEVATNCLVKHANRHVPKFLALPELDVAAAEESRAPKPSSLPPRSHPIQLVRDGRRLTAQRLLKNNVDDLTLTRPILVHDTARSIGMKVMQHHRRDRPVTVRDVADLLGHDYPVRVIDVEHQEELDGWRLADLVEYFEDEERLFLLHQQELVAARRNDATIATNESSSSSTSGRRRRKAAQKCLYEQTLQRPRVINQISLEFSNTPMADHFLSPQFVRELDWIDHAWPRRRSLDGTLTKDIDEIYPNAQYYCLTSEAGCWTDFHIDFGGSAVWYHVLNGEKEFCLIPPTPENLSLYECWLCSPDQAEVFFPTLITNPEGNVFRISLKAGQTFVIPSAWIHAVYTPSDSLVIGGNFLTGLDISLQLQVYMIEKRSRVKDDYRLPYFVPLNFYAGGYYLSKLRRGKIAQREVDGLGDLIEALEHWWKGHGSGVVQSQYKEMKTPIPTIVSCAIEAAEKNDCGTVEEFLAELRMEHRRVLADGIAPNPAAPLKSVLPSSAAMAASESKLKLKLSLKSRIPPPPLEPPKPDPISIESSSSAMVGAPESATHDGTETKSAKTNIRIVLPASAISSSIASGAAVSESTKKQKRPRGDTEWIDDGLVVDDEWLPTGAKSAASKSSRRRAISGSLAAVPKKASTHSSTAAAVAGTRKLPASKRDPAPTTSRQRLMKRFG